MHKTCSTDTDDSSSIYMWEGLCTKLVVLILMTAVLFARGVDLGTQLVVLILMTAVLFACGKTCIQNL